MIISNDAEKAADKTQHSFLIKTQRSRNRRNFFIMIKNIIILRANIILKDKRLNAFFLRSRTRKRWLLLPLLFNMVLEVLTREVRQENKKQKHYLTWKGRNEFMSIHTQYDITYRKLSIIHQKLSELIRFAECKTQHIEKSVVLLYTSTDDLKRKLK